MSDAAKDPVEPRPPEAAGRPPAASDPDAWATACQEDLEAEQARRQARYGRPPLDPARELRRLADAVTDVLTDQLGRFGLAAAPLAHQARTALEPVIERNAEVFRHLAAAGGELLAAYRAAVENHERDWARPDPPAAPRAGGEGAPPGSSASDDRRDPPPEATGPHRIDLD